MSYFTTLNRVNQKKKDFMKDPPPALPAPHTFLSPPAPPSFQFTLSLSKGHSSISNFTTNQSTVCYLPACLNSVLLLLACKHAGYQAQPAQCFFDPGIPACKPDHRVILRIRHRSGGCQGKYAVRI